MIDEAELPTPIRHAIESVRRHPRIVSATIHLSSKTRTEFEALFDTDLPSRWRADGVSPSGVRAVEPVCVVFDASYPTSAPSLYLRPDFNRSLPHINPHREGDPVPPCVVFGGVTEFFHREGLGALLDQMALWLRNAGREELISLAQGWEPMRRDEIANYLVFDPAQLESFVTGRGRHAYLNAGFVAVRSQSGALGLALGAMQDGRVQVHRDKLGELFNASLKDGHLIGKTLAILCWPGNTPSGAPFVCDHYLPETVATFEDLLARAETYGCAQPLRDAISWLRKSTGKSRRKYTYPLFIVLAARRPAVVIGSTSSIEFLAYRCDLSFPGALADGSAIEVQPVAHCHPVTVPLLRRMSGLDVGLVSGKVSMLGCGSLGSKIGLHMVRAGVPPTALLDAGSFRPHNTARHALLPGDDVKPAFEPSKARALADAVGEFGGTTPFHWHGNFLHMAPGMKEFEQAFPRDSALIVNTTASHAVRDRLGVLGSAMPGQVVEGALADDGRIGLLTIEGRSRNPDTTDLIATAYEDLRSQGRLAALSGLSARPTRIPIGVGCDSVTLVMTDARVSLHAAAMGWRLIDWVSRGIPDQALVHVGVLGNDGMSLAWRSVEVGPTHAVLAENDSRWSIRVLDRAHRRIVEDSARWPSVETGGVIVGRISPVRRLVHITDVIDAPSDSRRSAGAFVLGTDKLSEAVDSYEATGAGALWCLGTWHSHLADQGGSTRDYRTAEQLRRFSEGPIVMLIKRPGGYSAIVKEGS